MFMKVYPQKEVKVDRRGIITIDIGWLANTYAAKAHYIPTFVPSDEAIKLGFVGYIAVDKTGKLRFIVKNTNPVETKTYEVWEYDDDNDDPHPCPSSWRRMVTETYKDDVLPKDLCLGCIYLIQTNNRPTSD